MYRIATGLLILCAGLILASCQSLTKDECIAADWRVIGEQDGSEGREPQARFGQHVKACERAGIIPDQTLWNQGYQRGLFNFCTPVRGLSHGQAGQVYNNVCPPALETGFLAGYNLGREEYDKKSEIRNLESRIASKEREIRQIDDDLDDGDISEREARRATRDAREDIRDFNRDIGRAEADLGNIQRRIEFFRQSADQGRVYN